MRNIKLIVNYNGKRYSGWQSQPGEDTVQARLERALSRTCKEVIRVVAAGRTDAGVHAFGQVVNFYSNIKIDIGNFPKVVNYHLPPDISVVSAEFVEPNFSARYSAKSKEYKYVVYNHRYRNAIYSDYSYQYPFPVDVELMQKASEILIGEHDFASFMGRKAVVKDSIREIYSIEISRNGDVVEFLFHGKSFLKNMIRIIVGTLLEIGRGRLTVDDLQMMLDSKNRALSGPTAGGNGLFLMKVHY